MGRLIFSILVTLDGFIDHEVMLADEELHEYSTSMLDQVGTVLFGRRMYQLFESAWPPLKTDPSVPAYMNRFAQRIDGIDKIVFSRTLDHAGWNHSRLLREVDPASIEKLKQEGDLALAGADLAQTFMQHDLIDEYVLIVNPIILGQGVPLFKNIGSRKNLKLTGTRIFESGVVVLNYARNSTQAFQAEGEDAAT